jgi:hypothetical protein
LALALGDQLVSHGHLAEREDVFWLSVIEVDELAQEIQCSHTTCGTNVLRKRAHEHLAATHPPNDFTLPEGAYLPQQQGKSSRQEQEKLPIVLR